jgi:hypothetical protein
MPLHTDSEVHKYIYIYTRAREYIHTPTRAYLSVYGFDRGQGMHM